MHSSSTISFCFYHQFLLDIFKQKYSLKRMPLQAFNKHNEWNHSFGMRSWELEEAWVSCAFLNPTPPYLIHIFTSFPFISPLPLVAYTQYNKCSPTSLIWLHHTSKKFALCSFLLHRIQVPQSSPRFRNLHFHNVIF